MFERTSAVINKTVNDAKKFSLVTDIIAQVVFILMYVYSLVVNLSHLPRLIIYACLLLLATVYFIFHLATLQHKDKKAKRAKRKVQKSFKYGKWVVQAVAIGFSVYEIAVLDVTDLAIIIKALTMVSFVVQILCEVCSRIIDRYFSLLRCAFTADVQPVTAAVDFMNQLKNPKAFVAAAVDKPLKYIADKLTNTPPAPPAPLDEEQKREIKLNEEIAALVAAQRQKNKESRRGKAEDKSRSVKEHWQTIMDKLRRKKKQPKENNDQQPTPPEGEGEGENS